MKPYLLITGEDGKNSAIFEPDTSSGEFIAELGVAKLHTRWLEMSGLDSRCVEAFRSAMYGRNELTYYNEQVAKALGKILTTTKEGRLSLTEEAIANGHTMGLRDRLLGSTAVAVEAIFEQNVAARAAA